MYNKMAMNYSNIKTKKQESFINSANMVDEHKPPSQLR